jgi:Protein of unknown function (DUF4240)
MERTRFWSLAEAAKEASGGDGQRQAALLGEQLRQLPLSDITEFHHTLEALHMESLRADLWDAAAVVNQWDSSDRSFCSEDRCFIFRSWLVAEGHRVYQAAITDPDSLADFPELGNDLPWREWLWGVAMKAYTDRTGGEMPGLAAGRVSSSRRT